MRQQTLVSVVDDDESVREALPDLIETFGFVARAFASAEEFLASNALGDTRCLVLDVSMATMSGPQLQAELKRRQIHIPIIFITGQDDPTLRATLRARGAVECLCKPLRERDLRLALADALGLDRGAGPLAD